MKLRYVSAAAAAAALAIVGTVAPVGAQSTETGVVYVVHGVPGVTVDVYIDGTLTLNDFAPSSVSGPFGLSATDHRITVFQSVPGPTENLASSRTDTPVIDETEAVPAGLNVSLVAHYSNESTLTVSPFVNNMRLAAVPSGRLEVRHTAAAPEVDIVAGGSAIAPFTQLVTGDAAAAEFPPADYPTGIAATGTTNVLFDAPVTVERGVYTIVYAVGRFGTDFGVVIHTIDELSLDDVYQQTTGLDASIVRLYVTILGRQPDLAGFAYWRGIAEDGNGNLVRLVYNMAESAEFERRYGNVFGESNQVWVEHLYSDVLGRGSDSEGIAYWIGEINAGRLTQEETLLYFSESAEFKNLTGTS